MNVKSETLQSHNLKLYNLNSRFDTLDAIGVETRDTGGLFYA